MALLRKNLVPVYLFEKQEIESGYAGTEIADMYIKTVQAVIQPASSAITSMEYGSRADSMVTVYFPLWADVGENHRLSFTDGKAPTHKIISVKRYQNQEVILAEEMT